MGDITVGRHPVVEQLEELRAQLGELAEFPVFGIPDQQLPELVCLARAAASRAQAVYLNLLAHEPGRTEQPPASVWSVPPPNLPTRCG